MDEDNAVKAPVTRLRRRLSTEPLEERASTPNTPTKKRATRRTKPELDLIDENAATPQGITPQKRNLRKNTKDVLEPVEEKPVTPARRSTRIKSNTSILSESAATVAVDSPRARRAARRNSQLGSDNEAIITPTRPTRRTRKDSTSSIDKGDTEPIVVQIAEAIEEEPEIGLRKSTGESKSPYNLRKSPRQNEKYSKEEEHLKTPLKIQNTDKDNESSNLTIAPANTETSESPEINNAVKLSESAINLITNLDKENRNNKNHLNKSTSILESSNIKSKKKRTKSWSTISNPNPKDTDFFSDNDSKKSKFEKVKIPLLNLKNKGSGDNNLNANKSVEKEEINQKETKDCSVVLGNLDNISPTVQRLEQQHLSSDDLFSKEPTGVCKPKIIIEDSDSNSDRVPDKNYSSEDQCVPVVSVPVSLIDSSMKQDNMNNISANNSSQLEKNDVQNESVEPMDIDETIPDHILLQESDIKDINNSQLNENPKMEDKNKSSKRKSFLSQSLNKTENKSTLILTEIKDSSANEISKSETSQVNKSMTKSMVDLDQTQNNEIERKNVSSNCLTSTPLQQKNFHKLVAPINTSIIKLNQDTVKSPLVENTSKHSNKSKNETSDDDSSDEDISKEKNELLDDEADDAGDDYESGDSRDEDERQIEKENEIIDKGVTLTSDEDLSNDTDYEKDSFVVSSDEEDYQLLDGTSDDLSMSDNELKMTSKSKKKYNERMAKQQKKASREMFDARHKLNSSKSKKVNKIDDSSESSDSDDVPTKQRKGNRMRLDSSHETSMLSIDETKKITKKTKQLSDSVCDKSVLNEKEITMQNVSIKESDPLAEQIKEEPKTPNKDINSTLDFVDAKDANNTRMNETTTANENLIDPLHTSNQEDLSSSDSDTNNIIEHYDSILNSLNKGNKKKTHDMSLDIERAKKEKNKKEPVIDELNLTQVKMAKKSKKNTENDIGNSQTLNKSSNNAKQNDLLEKLSDNSKKQSEKEQKKHKSSKDVNTLDDSSSDSIDLQLLFSEDSNSGSMNNNKSKHGDNDGIPLKQSIAKTDIRINSDMDEADGNVSFFIDTEGDYGENKCMKNDLEAGNKSIDRSLTSSSKRKKNKSLSQSIVDEDIHNERINENDGNTSNVKTPKNQSKTNKHMSQNSEDCGVDADTNIVTPKSQQKKRKSTDQQAMQTMQTESLEDENTVNISTVKTPKSDKKKKKRDSESQANAMPDAVEENLSMSQTDPPKSDKKKKRVSETQANEHEDEITKQVNMSISDEKTPKNKKDRKNKLSQSNADASLDVSEVFSKKDDDNTTMNSKTPTSEKKKHKKPSESIEISTETLGGENAVDISAVKTPKSDKKKKKRDSQSQVIATPVAAGSEDIQDIEDGNLSVSKTPKQKKKRDVSESHEDVVTGTPSGEIVDKDPDASNTKTPKSDKKKKKRHSESLADVTQDKNIVNDLHLNTSNIATPNSQSKTKNHLTESKMDSTKEVQENSDSDCPEEVAIQMQQPNAEIDNEETKKSSAKKKKKKKNRTQTNTKQETSNDNGDNNESSSKKRKRRNASGDELTEDTQGDLNAEIEEDKNKKRKISKTEDVSLERDVVKKTKNKKRKEREDDDMGVSKVRKINTLEKMSVPRLPSSIISQLNDVPKVNTKKKPRVIATSQFVVEDSRRNKPSNYLEESIYLNEDSPKKKPKSNIPKPKVLPTMPTASSSNTGYTTNFKVNVIPSETKFVAQVNNVGNFKEDRLYNKNIKRLGTYEMYKKQRNIKLSKF